MSYIYCLSNLLMPGLIKLGADNMEVLLDEANKADEWRPPAPYTVEFAKQVPNAEVKANAIFALLEKHAIGNGFFRMSPEKAKPFFDLVDGEEWKQLNYRQEGEAEPKDILPPSELPKVAKAIKGCRDMAKCFANGQQIRHICGDMSWIGMYHSLKNAIFHNGIYYKSLSGFALAHYQHISPGRRTTINGWDACEYEIGGVWLSTYSVVAN